MIYTCIYVCIPLIYFILLYFVSSDQTPPVPTCPDQVQHVGVGVTSAVVFFPTPSATDNSGAVPTIVSQTHSSGDTFQLGSTLVTVTFQDGSGNTASCNFSVSVIQGQYRCSDKGCVRIFPLRN